MKKSIKNKINVYSERFIPSAVEGSRGAQDISFNSAQDRQDAIFRKMSADKKIELGSQLWQLAKELAGNKIRYGNNRPKTSFGKNR